MITSEVVGVVLFVLAVVGLGIYVVRTRDSHVLPIPVTWVHEGMPPPPGFEVALEVIGDATPGMPKAGTIIWMPTPFLNGGVLAAGTVDSYDPIRIRVLYDPLVERTALAHELGHVWSYRTHQGFGESPQDPRFVTWFTTVNRDIARRLGR